VRGAARQGDRECDSAAGRRAIAGPVIDKIIGDRVDLANRLIQAAKSGDVAEASEVVVEGYLIIEAEFMRTHWRILDYRT
jgi:hypothetical protein